MGFKQGKRKDYFLFDTNVENIFINEYMTGAPGDFVKVYLFAMMYAGLGVDMTDEDIAKQLSLKTEDVIKAWNHWEHMGAVKKVMRDTGDGMEYDIEFVVLKEQLYGEEEQPPARSGETHIQSFMTDSEVQEMFASIEQTTGRILGATEMKEIISWIRDYNAAPPLIAYGYSYCVKKKKTNVKYIEAVIKNWLNEGLRSVEDVEKYLSESEKKQHLYGRVFRALGFSRHATEEERRIMDTWFDVMEFSLDKVLDACSKTSGISNPNINYVNKVLVNWYDDKKSGRVAGEDDLSAGEIMEYYDLLRTAEEREAEQRRLEVYSRVPQIKEIEDELNRCSVELSRLVISDRVDKKEASEKIKSRIERLNTEKAFLLTDNGFELYHMEIKYECPECRDTGILETGERCQCFGEITKTKIQMVKNRIAAQQ